MKAIIAGSRTITDYSLLETAIKRSGFTITEVVSGNAKGVDKLGEEWARNNRIPIRMFPANWEEFGKKAGFLRNQQMAQYADILIAIWDGKSKGTSDIIQRCLEMNKDMFVTIITENRNVTVGVFKNGNRGKDS